MNLSFKKSVLLLRISIITLVMAIVSLFLFSFTVAHQMADEVWKQLGISQQQGTDKIRSSFMNGYLDHYGIRNSKNIASGNRAAAASDLLNYAKKYINSPQLKAIYDKERIAARPSQPELKAPDKEQIRKDKIAEMNKGIKSSEEIIKQMPTMEKSLKPSIDMFRKTIREYENPASKQIEAFYQYAITEQKETMERYQEDVKRWEENFPADHKQRLKGYLEKYLELAATVDFGATLKEQNGKMRFENAAYERKSADWKMIYRAGREVYEVTRPFAEKWLAELK